MNVQVASQRDTDRFIRSCAGCRRKEERDALLRFAISDQPPYVVPDVRRKLPGRGVSVHPSPRCLRLAVERGSFAKAARRPLSVDSEELAVVAAKQHELRTMGLLSAGIRSKHVALGTDAVREMLDRGRAKLLLVATDAQGRREDLVTAALLGQVPTLTWSTKAQLGRMAGRGEIGVLSIQDARIAREVSIGIARVQALVRRDE